MIPVTLRAIYYAALLDDLPIGDFEATNELMDIHLVMAEEDTAGTSSAFPSKQEIMNALLKRLEEQCSE